MPYECEKGYFDSIKQTLPLQKPTRSLNAKRSGTVRDRKMRKLFIVC